jgi:hypothetical protein
MIKRIILLFALALVITGCEPAPEQADPIASSWYRPMDNPAHEYIKYPNYLYQPVQTELVPQAVAGLGKNPLLQLSTSEAEQYAGNSLKMPMELRPFLIYGLSRPGGQAVVYYADRALWVDNLGGAGNSAEITEVPLVIFIDEVPPDVYVTAGQSEQMTIPLALPEK